MSGSKGQEIVYTWARLNTPTHKELSDTIDAALRRAKAEGVRGLIGHEQLAIQILNALERGGYLVSGPDGEEIGMTILDEADKFLDARAAQIEEGE